jgi:hypothetical protein
VTALDGLNDDFRDMVSALCDAGAEFLIVGAYAVSFHGHPRATGDLDLLVRPTPENARRVHAAMVSFGVPVVALGITVADLQRPDVVCQVGQPPRRIDLLTSISGVDFDTAWKSRTNTTWRGRTVAFLGRDALIANKKASGRAKDLEDVRRLEQRRE